MMSNLDPHLVSLVAPTSVEAEQYRTLRNAVERVAKDKQAYVIAVSSPGTGDGKTITAINLAGALAQSETKRILLLDADFRASVLAKRLGLSQQRGLAEAIVSEDPLDTVVVTSLPFNLAVVPAGCATRSPYEMLCSPRFRELIGEARRRYDFIVVDTPPIVSVSDCRLIAELVDGFVLVVAARRTTRAAIEEALRIVDPGKVLGFVLNDTDASLFGRAPA